MNNKFELKKNHMTINCDGGMGNRLNSLIGGIWTSKKLNIPYTITWPPNNACGCYFHDLFDTTTPVTTQGINSLFENNIKNIFLIHKNHTKFELKRWYKMNEDSLKQLLTEDDHIVYYHDQIPELITNKDIINILSGLKIQKHILEEINNFCLNNKIDSTVQGVHLRLTDRSHEINVNDLYNIVLSQPDNKFFVCSDSLEWESKFSLLDNVFCYPKTEYVTTLISGKWRNTVTDQEGRISEYNVNRSRNSVIQAFIDLLILSKTSILATNKNSTFLKIAYLYNSMWGEVK